MVVAGGSVTLEGAVGGNLRVAGGEVRLDNPVSGAVLVRAGTLTIGESARIEGPLTYWSPREAEITEAASIGGAVTYHPVSGMDRRPFRRAFLWVGIGSFLYRIGGSAGADAGSAERLCTKRCRSQSVCVGNGA